MFLVVFVCLCVCLFVCLLAALPLKTYQSDCNEIYGGVWVVKGTLNFCGDSDHHTDCPIGNLAIAQQIEWILMKIPGKLCCFISYN